MTGSMRGRVRSGSRCACAATPIHPFSGPCTGSARLGPSQLLILIWRARSERAPLEPVARGARPIAVVCTWSQDGATGACSQTREVCDEGSDRIVLLSPTFATCTPLVPPAPTARRRLFDAFTAVPLLAACFGAAAATFEDSSLAGFEFDRAVETTVNTTPVEV